VCGFVLGAVVDGVDADPVGVDVEVVARCELADGDGGGPRVLGAVGDEAAGLLVTGVVGVVGSPEADFEGDGLVEECVVGQQPERLEGAEGVLALGAGDPPGDVAELSDDATERLGVLAGGVLELGEGLLAFPEPVSLVGEGLDVGSPAVDDPLDVVPHVGGRPRRQAGGH
jgi:hypothetical protein